MTVFADAFVLIAWLNPADNAHARVATYLDGFTGRLLTTEWVLMELADALSAPKARTTAVTFLQAVRADSSVPLVPKLRLGTRGCEAPLRVPARELDAKQKLSPPCVPK